MQYREIAGEKVGCIGLGCEHLDRKPAERAIETVGAALEYGVNLFDVFMPGCEVRENIAKALGERRKDVMIQGHIGSTDVKQQYDISRDLPTVQKYFEEALRIFGGYIDFGMMFFIDSENDYKNVFETGFADYVQRLKKQGDIRHIGFSSHNPVTAVKAIQTGLPEMLMFSVNPAFDMLPAAENIFDHFETDFGVGLFRGIDPKRAELYTLCAEKEIGITVMKVFGAGKLLSKEHTPFGKPLTSAQCLHYALSRPAVQCVLPGCQTREEVEGVMRYFGSTDSERDYAETLATMRNNFRGSCVYCGHCQPCPSGIDIAAAHKYLDIARLNPDNGTVKAHLQGVLGEPCIACGNCEERCPFGVPVIKNIAEAQALT
ncbi:MAG: aldo/keto reductase [Oscillospiraceae bacterium]|jgi:predicted aldo/keto reductase-like oxidoreductase|nr:aldo/keto reductase [Oscillospiraceae bacterium]